MRFKYLALILTGYLIFMGGYYFSGWTLGRYLNNFLEKDNVKWKIIQLPNKQGILIANIKDLKLYGITDLDKIQNKELLIGFGDKK